MGFYFCKNNIRNTMKAAKKMIARMDIAISWVLRVLFFLFNLSMVIVLSANLAISGINDAIAGMILRILKS
jgi:hypothetical protein